ncbi:formyltetrahydrofolate deformylase [Verrucomicrobiota bacterium]
MSTSAIMLISCPDQQGLVAAVTDFLKRHSGNIINLEQHVDREDSMFFMRVEWDMETFDLRRDEISQKFGVIADRYSIKYTLRFSDYKPRMALMVSKLSHCFYDLLARYYSGEWNVEIPLIISNHPDMAAVAEKYGIPYHIFEITKESKAEQEAKELELMRECQIDFIVLARYMQVLSDKFVAEYPNRVINIHHSFLPAFAGARPYHNAHARGVKIIGATSHYVTADLDEGPIIEQDVVGVSHRESIEDLVRKGRDVEKIVLARAVLNHVENKVLVHKNRTVVFN